jgi:AraC-like DNA-binding protein
MEELQLGSLNAYYPKIVFSALAICFVGYKGIRQTSLIIPEVFFQGDFPISKTKLDIVDVVELPNINILKQQFFYIMGSRKTYLDEELNLYKLADLTGISEKKLSLLLNRYLDTNFYDFVNGYLVRAIKEKFREETNSKYTIMAIANDCGFRSKSSFNRVFKRETGLSPSEYKKQLLTQEET